MLKKLKEKLSTKVIKSKFDKKIDLKTTIDVGEQDTENLMPQWFRNACKIPFLNGFTYKRRRERDYTLPFLTPSLYDKVYKRQLTLAQKSRILSTIYRNLNHNEQVFLMKLRRMLGLNQHYKKELYKIACMGLDDPYRKMYDAGFGFEFLILSTASNQGRVKQAISDLLTKTEELMRSETVFLSVVKDLKMAFLLSMLRLFFGCLLVVYTTLILPGFEFSEVYGILRPGLDICRAFGNGYYLPLIMFTIQVFAFIGLFFYLDIDELILISMKTTREILMWFESMKFYTTLDIVQSMETTTEERLFTRAIGALEIKVVKEFLLAKLKALEMSTDITKDFLTSTSFFDEDDISYLIDVQGQIDKNKFEANVARLVRDKQAATSTRERSDTNKLTNVQAAIYTVATLILTVVYVFGDLQMFYVSLGG